MILAAVYEVVAAVKDLCVEYAVDQVPAEFNAHGRSVGIQGHRSDARPAVGLAKYNVVAAVVEAYGIRIATQCECNAVPSDGRQGEA